MQTQGAMVRVGRIRRIVRMEAAPRNNSPPRSATSGEPEVN